MERGSKGQRRALACLSLLDSNLLFGTGSAAGLVHVDIFKLKVSFRQELLKTKKVLHPCIYTNS